MTTKNGHHIESMIHFFVYVFCPDNLDCKMVKVGAEDEEFDSYSAWTKTIIEIRYILC